MADFLPSDSEKLTVAEQELWLQLRDYFSGLPRDYKVERSTMPPLEEFHLYASRDNRQHLYSWTVSRGRYAFTLSLVLYDYRYEEYKKSAIFRKIDRSLYLIGHVALRKDYGHVLIEPESISHKIIDWFVPIDIDFPEHPAFSKKYYVVAEGNPSLPASFLQYMETTDGLHLELKGDQLLFRLTKSLNQEDVVSYCEIGIKLSEGVGSWMVDS